MSGLIEEQNLIKWLKYLNVSDQKTYRLADVGCYNINGSVRNQIQSYDSNLAGCIEVVGFDFNVNHENDIKINDDGIPEIYHNKFDLITCIGTFNYGDNNVIMNEIKLLSKINANILINVDRHTSRGGSASLPDGHSYTKNCKVIANQFEEFLNDYPFEIINCIDELSGHEYVYFYLKRINDESNL